MRRTYTAIRQVSTCWFMLTVIAGGTHGQTFSSAYRVLGQTGFEQNGLNMVQGVELSSPSGVALDLRGGQLHVYISDTGNHRVLAWRDAASYQAGDPPAIILGQPGPQYAGPFGIGVKGFNTPLGVTVDPTTGNLYVTDYGNNRILRFLSPFANPSRAEPDAVFGQQGFTTTTALASKGTLNGPRAAAFDSAGNLWVADTGNHRVVRFSAASLNNSTPPDADSVIGQPDINSSAPNGGGGSVSASGFNSPASVAFDSKDNLYVADFDNARVLKFSQPLNPSTPNPAATAVWGQADFKSRGVPTTASNSSLPGPLGLSVDRAGALYVAVAQDNRVLVFPADATGGASTVLGQADFAGTKANASSWPWASSSSLNAPRDVRTSSDGSVFVVDTGNNRVIAFPSGAKSAARVWGQNDFTSDGPNQVKPASMNAAYMMAIDYSASPYVLYVSDSSNNRVLAWRDSVRFRSGDPADFVIGQPDLTTAFANIDTAGSATPSQTSLSSPRGIVVDQKTGTLYVADSANNRVLRYPRPASQTGRVSPDAVIGQTDFGSANSALVTASSLRAPGGVALGPDGDLFVADAGNNRVLEFPSGAGTGASAIRVYGQPSLTSNAAPAPVSPQTLNAPQGVFVDQAFTLYVADTASNRVLIFPNTQSAPAAGMPAAFVLGPATFGTATPSLLRSPVSASVDSSSNIYVSDYANNRVLTFPSLVFLPSTGGAPSGVTGQQDLKGTSANWNSPNGLATANSLYGPLGIYVDRRDTMYVGDSGNNRVLHFLKAASPVNAATYQSGTPVAPGGLVSLFGQGMADAQGTAGSAPWPTTLSNREVVFNDELKAAMNFIGANQVNFQMPQTASVGGGRLAVRVGDTGELIAGGTIAVAASSPGLFTASQDGKGQASAVNQDGRLNTSSNAAPRGTVVTLFGTGQGQVSPPVMDGQAATAAPLSSTVTVLTSDARSCTATQPSMCILIGTSSFGEIQFSGLAPGYVGLWQINVKIPADAPVGNAVPFRVLINAVPSNVVSISIK